MKNYYFASTYGSGDYNTSTYNGAATTSTTGSDGSEGSTGVLADTGFGVLVAVTLSCLIIFVALLVKFWRRKPVQAMVENSSNSVPERPRLM